jgi:hypothetical protein
MRKIVATLALITLIGYAWHLFQQMTKLDQRVSAAEQTNQHLEETVNLVREQAEQSLDAIEAAEQLERQTREQAAAEVSRAAQAAQDRATAEGHQQRALETIATSHTAVEQAAAAAERQRRERREEWQRLGSALRKIAPTETGAARHRVDLSGLRKVADGAFDGKSRETLSRLAGALLANYGYAAQLNGTEARAIRDYLVTAGLPGDSISLEGSPGENRLDLLETVLTHP